MNTTILTPAQLSEYLNVTVKTLAKWRHEGGGPPFVKYGKLIRYRASDIDEWMENRVHTRTDILEAETA